MALINVVWCLGWFECCGGDVDLQMDVVKQTKTDIGLHIYIDELSYIDV